MTTDLATEALRNKQNRVEKEAVRDILTAIYVDVDMVTCFGSDLLQ